MSDRIKITESASVLVGRSGKPRGSVADQVNPQGIFVVDHYRDGLLLGQYRVPNTVTIEGKNYMLDVSFDNGTKWATWYMGLVDNANYTGVSENDTYDDIDQAGNGWDEFKSFTDPGNGDSTVTRPVWNPDPASGKSITNSTQTVFDITGSGTVKGLFIAGGTNAVTKGNHDASNGEILWCATLFDQGDTAVVNGDQLKVTYTVNT